MIGCLGIPALLLVLIILGLGVWYQVEMRQARRALATELKYVRERGVPLTSLDLEDSYRLDPQREDVTAELLKLLAIADDRQLQTLAAALPIVGNGASPPSPGKDWPQLDEVEAYLGKHQAMRDFVATLPNRPFTVRYPVDLTQGMNAKLPHVQQVRHAARLLQLQCHVDLHRNLPAEAVKRILEVLALSDTLANEPIIISQLVRCALQGVALRMLADTLQHADVSDADLLRLQTALQQFDGQQSWRQGLQGERAMAYTASTLPLNKIGSPTLTRADLERFASRQPPRPHDAALTLRIFRQMEVATDESLLKAIEAGAETDSEVKLIAAHPVKRVVHMQSLLYTPALGTGVQAAARTDASLQSAATAIAALRFRRANRVWPQQLSQLVPEFLTAVPTDPFDGQPLRMVVTDSEFKVYSIGKDKVDQGGDLAEPQMRDLGFVAPWRDAK